MDRILGTQKIVDDHRQVEEGPDPLRPGPLPVVGVLGGEAHPLEEPVGEHRPPRGHDQFGARLQDRRDHPEGLQLARLRARLAGDEPHPGRHRPQQRARHLLRGVEGALVVGGPGRAHPRGPAGPQVQGRAVLLRLRPQALHVLAPAPGPVQQVVRGEPPAPALHAGASEHVRPVGQAHARHGAVARHMAHVQQVGQRPRIAARRGLGVGAQIRRQPDPIRALPAARRGEGRRALGRDPPVPLPQLGGGQDRVGAPGPGLHQVQARPLADPAPVGVGRARVGVPVQDRPHHDHVDDVEQALRGAVGAPPARRQQLPRHLAARRRGVEHQQDPAVRRPGGLQQRGDELLGQGSPRDLLHEPQLVVGPQHRPLGDPQEPVAVGLREGGRQGGVVDGRPARPGRADGREDLVEASLGGLGVLLQVVRQGPGQALHRLREPDAVQDGVGGRALGGLPGEVGAGRGVHSVEDELDGFHSGGLSSGVRRRMRRPGTVGAGPAGRMGR